MVKKFFRIIVVGVVILGSFGNLSPGWGMESEVPLDWRHTARARITQVQRVVQWCPPRTNNSKNIMRLLGAFSLGCCPYLCCYTPKILKGALVHGVNSEWFYDCIGPRGTWIDHHNPSTSFIYCSERISRELYDSRHWMACPHALLPSLIALACGCGVCLCINSSMDECVDSCFSCMDICHKNKYRTFEKIFSEHVPTKESQIKESILLNNHENVNSLSTNLRQRKNIKPQLQNTHNILDMEYTIKENKSEKKVVTKDPVPNKFYAFFSNCFGGFKKNPEESQKTIFNFQEEKTQFEPKSMFLEKENNFLKIENKELKQDLDVSKKKLEESQKVINELKLNNSSLQKDNENLVLEKNKLKEEKENAVYCFQEEKNRLKNNLSVYQQQLDSSQKKVKELELKNTSLQETNKTLDKNLKEVISDIEHLHLN